MCEVMKKWNEFATARNIRLERKFNDENWVKIKTKTINFDDSSRADWFLYHPSWLVIFFHFFCLLQLCNGINILNWMNSQFSENKTTGNTYRKHDLKFAPFFLLQTFKLFWQFSKNFILDWVFSSSHCLNRTSSTEHIINICDVTTVER